MDIVLNKLQWLMCHKTKPKAERHSRNETDIKEEPQFKPHTNAKLNCLKWNCFFDIETVLILY